MKNTINPPIKPVTTCSACRRVGQHLIKTTVKAANVIDTTRGLVLDSIVLALTVNCKFCDELLISHEITIKTNQ